MFSLGLIVSGVVGLIAVATQNLGYLVFQSRCIACDAIIDETLVREAHVLIAGSLILLLAHPGSVGQQVLDSALYTSSRSSQRLDISFEFIEPHIIQLP